MSKRNISYVKPEEPSFLKKIKAQLNYKEGPTVETKKQKLESEDFDESDPEEEEPQVVVLNPGDLTSEQAKIEKSKLEKAQEERKADLNERVLFKPKSKILTETAGLETTSSRRKSEKHLKSTTKIVLSFSNDDEEESS